MKLSFNKAQYFTVPETLYHLINNELSKTKIPTPTADAATLCFRGVNYSASTGGYHPVEIRIEKVIDSKHPDCWELIYITDFSYQGEQHPELVKEIDACFINNRVYSLFGGWLNKRSGHELLKLFINNFIEYHSMGIYTVKVSFD